MEKYKEIFRLKKMLEDANIPFEFDRLYDGYIIEIYSRNHKYALCCAKEHHCSWGTINDLLQITYALTDKERENEVRLGNLTAEEVFKRFKYCYEREWHNSNSS